MRVLMLTDLYPPIIGGLELHVRNLARALSARGHQVAVATTWHEGQPEKEEVDGVRVYRLRGTVHRFDRVFGDVGRRFAPPVPDPGMVQALHRLMRIERPEVVHAHNWMLQSFLPVKRASGARLIVSLHDYGLVCAKRDLMYRGVECSGPGVWKCLHCAAGHYGAAKGVPITLGNWLMQPLVRSSVDLFIAVSRSVAAKNGLRRASLPFRLIPNFVPDDIASGPDGTDAALEGLPEDPFLLYVGALSHHKGIDVLLEAYAGLSGMPPLVCIGTLWPDSPTAYPPGVRMFHDISHAGVMTAWRRSMLGLVPSIFPDPCPTVAMEAMSAGRALIASRIGGLPDLVVHGLNGILVPPGQVNFLRDAIRRTVSDPDLRRQMGLESLKRVNAFKAGAVVEQIEAAYRDVLSRRPLSHGDPATESAKRLGNA
jgi:glycosyltransferase involved in cell wall biosynthesis